MKWPKCSCKLWPYLGWGKGDKARRHASLKQPSNTACNVHASPKICSSASRPPQTKTPPDPSAAACECRGAGKLPSNAGSTEKCCQVKDSVSKNQASSKLRTVSPIPPRISKPGPPMLIFVAVWRHRAVGHGLLWGTCFTTGEFSQLSAIVHMDNAAVGRCGASRPPKKKIWESTTVDVQYIAEECSPTSWNILSLHLKFPSNGVSSFRCMIDCWRPWGASDAVVLKVPCPPHITKCPLEYEAARPNLGMPTSEAEMDTDFPRVWLDSESSHCRFARVQVPDMAARQK